jgi:predicted acyl esterase
MAPPALKAIIPVSPTLMYDAIHPGATLWEWGPVFAPAVVQVSGPSTNVTAPGWMDDIDRESCATDHSWHYSELDGTFDEYWAERYFPLWADRMRAPVLTTGSLVGDHGATGDHDHVVPMWEALERAGVPRKAYLGQWAHGYPTLPGWSWIELRFLEHHLRGNDTGMMDEPALTLIDQLGNARRTDAFPRVRKLLLQAGGGRLAATAPNGSATYTEIPGMQRALRRSIDASRLLYASDPFMSTVRISGAPRLEVVASVDTTDTNFAGYLFDVAADGTRRIITRGWLDARHRNALDRPGEDLVPGSVERYVLVLQATEWTLQQGHRLELMVSSGDSCLAPSDECPWGYIDGVVPDPTVATVTVVEGDGMTSLSVPVV